MWKWGIHPPETKKSLVCLQVKLCSGRTCSTCSRSDTTICALQNLASTPRSPADLSPFCCSQSLSLKGLPTYNSQLMQVAQCSCDNCDEINLLLNPSFNKYWFWFWSSWGLFIIPTGEIRKGMIAFRNQVLTIRKLLHKVPDDEKFKLTFP